MWDKISDGFGVAQQALFEQVVEPVLMWLGLGGLSEVAFVGTGWFLLGVLQLLVIALVLVPLERWRPLQPLTDARTVRTDVLYTLIHRLGLFQLVMFFTLGQWMDSLSGYARVAGLGSFSLDALWPGVTDQPWVSLLFYLLVFDFLDYWFHRAQHQFELLWALHAVHHSQRQMTAWTDNREHLLSDMLRGVVMAAVAFLIGVPPGQFVLIVVITQLSQNLGHINMRLSFGALGDRLWISPRYHRAHHAIGIGHESLRNGRQVLGGCNFGILLPWWDMLFGTANFQGRYEATGIRDQVEQQRDYGEGFWRQQWLGLKRMAGKA